MSPTRDDSPEIPADLPDASRDVFAELMAARRRDVDALRSEVQDYLDRIAEKQEQYEFLNRQLAESIADRYLEILELLEDEGDPEAHRLVQAGLMYFVEPSDADDDFTSIIGFDDDCEVLNAIARHLDHPEYTVER